MSDPAATAPERSPWADAVLAAALFAVDPGGTVGVALRSLPGLARERWLATLRQLLPPDAPVRRLPHGVGDSRLLGGLDLAATLRAGRPIAERGILAETDGGVLVAAMAERMSAGTAARLGAVLDNGGVTVERDGIAIDTPTRFGIVALDEGMTEDERPPAALADRLAFRLDFEGVSAEPPADDAPDAADIAAARARLNGIVAPPDVVEALCGTALSLGVWSLRAPLQALAVARAHAALAGRDEIAKEDAAVAARLVLAPRATRLPLPPPEETPPEDEQQPDDQPPPEGRNEEQENVEDRPLEDMILEAAKAAIPAGLLEQLRLQGRIKPKIPSSGRAGHLQKTKLRGRPAGVRRGEPRAGGARLNIIETLRAAAPWQPLRRRERALAGDAERTARIEVRKDDFRITRFKQKTETATIFVVDASGSAALHRLAEAKGAVELLLAECYVRRDQVAMVAFRGKAAELLLPPTRSLVRAKRSLAGLPGGGGTPLACGLDLAVALADQIRRKGQTPFVILLTDGSANIARDGSPGRPKAEEDALASARLLRAAGLTALLVDTAPHPRPLARKIAAEMDAMYLPLPYADAAAISGAVKAVSPPRESLAG
ncbi:magnesium chelatase subunit D [Rhodoplanes sp. TEM]|uniref:Magnesium chelatase subunit D n=1 Tax=Rhodoplanes tepidamans TaxID=200616 RepID=A0ABT5J4W8_RHOTP|nr:MULTISPECIES: magnesium chelatase subunit D [Rhodoplanes]MDC7784628.1 magnesium chelatase subunit D [Rhodoplanes tepidamans]MDC7982920.1 magnesium chelatase subunit D [Rhodoplanes sp. TEM]MDQ0355856.1 magnesium chelatase subunit D [Rhodoplanes tepidamans]